MKKVLLFISIFSTLYAQKNILIDLKKQKLYAKENNKTILVSKITSGRVGHETPTGIFKILNKERMHISNLYPKYKDGSRGGAKMPYSLRISKGGVFIHAGEIVEYPNSHGCIRLPYGKAMQLFKWTTIGTKVKIINKPNFNDPINKERKELLALKKEYKTKKNKTKKFKTIVYDSNDVDWVKDSLNYYNNL